MAATLALQLAFSNYALAVCKALRSCNNPQELQCIVQGLLDLATLACEASSDLRDTLPAKGPGHLSELLRTLHDQLDQSVNVAGHIRLAFYQHLEVIVCSLLPGEASLLAAASKFL